MIWGHFALYVLYAVGSGAYRGMARAAKIARGAYGRARQAASRARTRVPLGDHHGYGSGKTMIGLDPSAEGGVALVAHPSGKGIMQTMPPGAGLAAFLDGQRAAISMAAEAQLRAARLAAVCPLADHGGCLDSTHCDVRGQCQAAALIAEGDRIRAEYERGFRTPSEIISEMLPGAELAYDGRPIPVTVEEAMIESPERPSAGLSELSGYPRTDSGCEAADAPATPREEACEPEPEVPGGYGVDLLGVDSGEREHVITEHDPAFNDLQTYLEGGPVESVEAAKRLDQRGVDYGQISPKTFWDTWGEEPRRSDLPHKIWCARWHQHRVDECPVWGAE